MIFGFSWIDLLLMATVFALAMSALRNHRMPAFQKTMTILAVIALVHVVVAGARWQILPAYGATVLVVLTSLISRRWLRYVSFGFTSILLAGSTAATWAFPVFTLPEPSGPYAIGTTSAFLTDEARPEEYTEQKDDKRRLALRIWYPSNKPESGEQTHYFQQPVIRSRAITKGTPMPWFTFTHLGDVRASARLGATIAEGQFPVLIYSHGLGIGWSSGNMPLVEQLASQGYIVIAIGHAYIGSSVILPEQVALFDPATRAAMNSEPPEEVMEIYSQVKEIQDADRQFEVYMQAMAMMPASIKGKVDVALRTQVDDQAFVLESLPTLTSGAADFRPHMDTSRVGFLGMSIGGSASIITCDTNPKCGAVINLDGFHPDQAGAELNVPSLSLHRSNNLLVNVNFNRAQADAFLLEVADTTHFNFFDFALMSPLYKRLGVLGPIDGAEGLEVQRDFVTAFFDKYLKGVSSPLIEGKQQHSSSNVTLRQR